MITIEKFGHTFSFESNSASIEEIFSDNYKIFDKAIPFERDDIIIDIGANIGAFSNYL